METALTSYQVVNSSSGRSFEENSDDRKKVVNATSYAKVVNVRWDGLSLIREKTCDAKVVSVA